MAPAVRQIAAKDVISDFIANNIWFPIVAVTFLVILTAIIIYCLWKWKHRKRYDYSILKSDMALPMKLEMERRLQYDTRRETAMLQCQLYLRSSGSYILVEHLPEIGSRNDKHWFVVRDSKTKTEKLLSMTSKGPQMLIPFTASSKNTLFELLSALQHPYLFPMYDLDLVLEQDKSVMILPYNSKGSLKDIIYHAHCMDSWNSKYYAIGTGLPPNLIALYARQILEGLLYLQKCGFPPFVHLHSGNVLLQNNTCRITGIENEFLGLRPKLHGLLTRKLRENKLAMEVICFGHLIYEMAIGNELDMPLLQVRHLEEIPHQNVREFLEFLFSTSQEDYHTLQELADHPFLKDIALIEMQVFTRPPAKFSKVQKTMIKTVKKGKPLGMKKTIRDVIPGTARPT